MSSITDDSLGLSQLQSVFPPPPQYTEAAAQTDGKGAEKSNFDHSPWLLRRTSIHVESTQNDAWQDAKSSHQAVAPSVRSNDEKKALRSLLNRFGNKLADDRVEYGRSHQDLGHFRDSSDFGTRVFIEAVQPSKAQRWKRHEMKGLEQAASMKRWPGYGDPVEPWGKLVKVSEYVDIAF